MPVGDRRYACERPVAGHWRVYDSIECLLRDSTAGGTAYLSDYDRGTLHAADSIWVVRADMPSPMGGGYAAFLDRSAAEEVAIARSGRVARLVDWASKGRATP